MAKEYYVTADHKHPDYRFKDTLVKVGGDEKNGFFAQHPKLGCGHTCKTEHEAICHMFRSHACEQIVVVEKPQHGLALKQLGRLMEWTLRKNEVGSDASLETFLGEINMVYAQYWSPARFMEEFLHWSWGEKWWERLNIREVLED